MTTYSLSGYAVSFNDLGTELTSFDFSTLDIITSDGVDGFSYTIEESRPGYLPVVSLDLEGVQFSIDDVLLDDLDADIRLGEITWGGGNNTVLLNIETSDGLIYSYDLSGDTINVSSLGGFQSVLSSFTEVGAATGDYGAGAVIPLDDSLAFSLSNDLWYGSLAGDTWSGGEGLDQLYARGGDDTIHGGDGNDHIRGSRGFDELYGDDGQDLITGGGKGDMIFGGRDSDELRGGRGRDVINGNGGFDEIDGGPGRDTLTGGVGQDVFVFEGNIDRDVITDFSITKDTLQLDVDIWGGGLSAQSVVNTYGTHDAEGNFVLDFSGGDTSPAADAIVFEGISDGDLIVDTIYFI